jgi:polar amino acid transport system substrate-binding protein
MMPSKHLLFLFCISLTLGALLVSGCLTESPAAQVPALTDLTYYTEQNPTFNYEENGTLQGFAVDILEAASEKAGQPVSRNQVDLVPWPVGYQAALTQNNTVLFTTARVPARERSFKWAGPVYFYTNVLFARYDRNITIAGLEDLKGYRIGVIADDVAVQQLRDLGISPAQLVQDTEASTLITKLDSGEIDLWAYSQISGRYFSWQVTGNAYSLRIVYTLPTVEGYYAFSQDVPDATVQTLQQGLDALKAEKDASGISTYDRILGQQVPIVGLAQLQYLTEEWAPYNYQENGLATGISVDILETVFRDIGVNRSRKDIRIVPLAEGFQEAQKGGTVLFSIVRTPEREPLYKWAGPFTRGSFVVYAPINRNISIATSEDLKRYRIGAVEGTVENTLLIEQGVNASEIVKGSTPEDLLRMLEDGRIDLWATGDLAGRHQMLQTASDPHAYEIVYTLSQNDFYFLFSKDTPDMLVSAFSQALQNVQNPRGPEGVSPYERIMYHYLGIECAPPSFIGAQVMDLVNMTAQAIVENASDTFRHIDAGETPYRDARHASLYVFVYDTAETMVAHAENIQLVGMNFKGKTDRGRGSAQRYRMGGLCVYGAHPPGSLL